MMVRAEAPLVHCWCPVVFRHSGHHRKWANVSIISSGEGLHSATTLLKSRVNSSQLPSDSFFLNIHLHFWHAERRKEGELTREREREWYLELEQFQLFPLYICSELLPGSRHRFPIPNHTRRGRAKWLRGAKFLPRCAETKQRLRD